MELKKIEWLHFCNYFIHMVIAGHVLIIKSIKSNQVKSKTLFTVGFPLVTILIYTNYFHT